MKQFFRLSDLIVHSTPPLYTESSRKAQTQKFQRFYMRFFKRETASGSLNIFIIRIADVQKQELDWARKIFVKVVFLVFSVTELVFNYSPPSKIVPIHRLALTTEAEKHGKL